MTTRAFRFEDYNPAGTGGLSIYHSLLFIVHLVELQPE